MKDKKFGVIAIIITVFLILIPAICIPIFGDPFPIIFGCGIVAMLILLAVYLLAKDKRIFKTQISLKKGKVVIFEYNKKMGDEFFNIETRFKDAKVYFDGYRIHIEGAAEQNLYKFDLSSRSEKGKFIKRINRKDLKLSYILSEVETTDDFIKAYTIT